MSYHIVPYHIVRENETTHLKATHDQANTKIRSMFGAEIIDLEQQMTDLLKQNYDHCLIQFRASWNRFGTN